MRRSILASAFLSVLFSLLVISCSSHDSSTSTTSESSDALTALAAIAVPASDTMTIGNYVLVSKVRYGRTAYDYTFRVSMSNSGSQYAQDVRAVLFSSVQTTVVISGTLDFGDIAPGETVQSQNTFTVRIDRLYTFNESDLIWEIQAAFPEAVGMIDSSGGTVEVTDPQSSLNGTVISLPAGALTENKNISIKETYLSSSLPHEVVNAGPIVDLGPDGMQFTQPVEVTLPYDDKDNDGIIDNCDVPEDQISVITFNTTSGAWENVQIISQDTQNNTVTIFVEHFSLYTTAAPSKSSDKNVIIFVVDGLKFEQLKRRAFSYALSSGKYFGWEAAILSACLKEWVDRKIETYSRPSYLEEALESKDVGLELLKSDIKFFDGSSQASTETEKAWNGDSEETPTLVKNLREALKDEWDRRGDKKFIIVSHSWGTVLSSLALAYEDQIKPDLMITLSSPFGTDNVSCDLSTTDELWSDVINLYTNWKVSATQYDLGTPSRSLFQSGTADEWINYWAYGDLMSGPLNAAGIADDDTIDPQETAQADERNQDTTHVWHAVTSLSKEMMDEKDDYNPSGESIYEEYGKDLIEKVKDQLQAIIGYTTPPDPISTLVGTMVWIPAGSFQMGSTDLNITTPVHTVTLSGFYLGATEVTQAQYLAVMGSNPSYFQGTSYPGRENCPVEMVTWYEAREFCARLTAMTPGYVFMLPSEAQWEYACRAGTTTLYSFGDSDALIGDYAWNWYYSDGHNGNWHGPYGNWHGPQPVGTRLPNPWGLYDMHGNVWELCLDSWHDDYTGAPTDGSAWDPNTGSYRMLRGGSWDYDDPRGCRSAYRIGYLIAAGGDDAIGFRVLAVPADD